MSNSCLFYVFADGVCLQQSFVLPMLIQFAAFLYLREDHTECFIDKACILLLLLSLLFGLLNLLIV